jgi:hypothetical protein
MTTVVRGYPSASLRTGSAPAIAALNDTEKRTWAQKIFASGSPRCGE